MFLSTVDESFHYGLLLTYILMSGRILLKSLAALVAVSNLSRGIVDAFLFIAANLVFANTKLQLTLPFSTNFIYVTVPYAFSGESENMCNSLRFEEKHLQYGSNLTWCRSFTLCFQTFQHLLLSDTVLCYSSKALLLTIWIPE